MTTLVSEFEDKVVRSQIWKGSVPVYFELSENDQNVQGTSFPYYCNISRTTFISLKSEEIHNFFSSSLSTTPSPDIWFELKNSRKPLKWQYPVGVLYDLYSESLLKLVVHLTNFPERELIRLGNEETLKKYFMNELKQATFVKRGDIKPINNFGLKDVDNLWKGLKENDYETFWSLNEKLYEGIHTIPVRLFKDPESPPQQYPIQAYKENGDLYTLGEFIERECPEWVNKREDGEIEFNCKVLIHGISPPMDTPMLWLSVNLSYPDNFLYIVISKV